MAFELTENYRYCIANDRVILLDVVSERYACLPDEIDAAFRHLATGGKGTAPVLAALAPLIEQGVLWEHCGGRGLPAVERLITPDRSVFESLPDQPRSHLHLTLAARVAESLLVRARPLEATLRAIEKRRPAPSRNLDDPAVLAALNTYLKTRHWLGNQDRCLTWSVGLVRYLQSIGFAAQFVLGVRISPWSAHAWVQHEATVLSDSLDRVLPYTPILAV